MAYDKGIERRIDGVIAAWPNIEKKKMFGGVCYLTGGNMCFGIWQEYLIVRTDPGTAREKLQLEHVRPVRCDRQADERGGLWWRRSGGARRRSWGNGSAWGEVSP
jgi:hypothetical protein